jgi:hypothetical protein
MQTTSPSEPIARTSSDELQAALKLIEQEIAPDADGIAVLPIAPRRSRTILRSALVVMVLGSALAAFLVGWPHLPRISLWQPEAETVSAGDARRDVEIAQLKRALFEAEAVQQKLQEELEVAQAAQQRPAAPRPWYEDATALSYRSPFSSRSSQSN